MNWYVDVFIMVARQVVALCCVVGAFESARQMIMERMFVIAYTILARVKCFLNPKWYGRKCRSNWHAIVFFSTCQLRHGI